MARKHLSRKLSDEERSLDEIWDWYEFQSKLIGEEAVRAYSASGPNAVPPRYFGKTHDELAELFEEQRAELRWAVVLNLIASTEAALKVDFIEKVIQNKKDATSKVFVALYKTQQLRVKLTDLLDIWRSRSTDHAMSEAVRMFKEALKLRHWLAHGRYWKPKLVRDFDPQDVFAICDGLLTITAIR